MYAYYLIKYLTCIIAIVIEILVKFLRLFLSIGCDGQSRTDEMQGSKPCALTTSQRHNNYNKLQ